MDLLQTCLDDVRQQASDATPDALARNYCVRCKNLECDRSGWLNDPLTERVRTQADRLLRPTQADPRSSRYLPIVKNDFEDKREEAEAWSQTRPAPPNFLEAPKERTAPAPQGVPQAASQGRTRPALRALPAQQAWDVGAPAPSASKPAPDPWDPRSGRTVGARATIQFRADGTLDLGAPQGEAPEQGGRR
jgi:hypothetical protein